MTFVVFYDKQVSWLHYAVVILPVQVAEIVGQSWSKYNMDIIMAYNPSFSNNTIIVI